MLYMWKQKIEKKSKSLSKSSKIDWRVIFLAQFRLAQDFAWLSFAQFGSAWLSLAQLGSAWLNSAQPGLTWLSTAIGSILTLKFKRSPFCSNTFEFFHMLFPLQRHQTIMLLLSNTYLEWKNVPYHNSLISPYCLV